MMPARMNVILHPRYSPTILPSGSPKIIAMDVPVTIILIAKSRCCSSTSFTAMTDATDQKIACADATMSLAIINMIKVGAIPDRICPIANTTSVTNNIGLKDTFDTAIMSGTDRIMTAHEYAVIIMPACDSLMEKAAAMDVNNPIGMNSDVLKIKAANVIPINGSHCFVSSFFIVFPWIFKNRDYYRLEK